MPALRALTRDVSRSLADCELTHLERVAIDVERARGQHEEYEAALRAAGCAVQRLPEAPDLPDAVFVEDTALVLDETAVILRPGALSRRPECRSVARALAPFRELLRMSGPGTIDGGDLVVLGRTIHVGRSTRSDAAGVAELATLLAPFGYEVRTAALRDGLHLKSAATALPGDALLVNPAWCDPDDFAGATEVVEVHPDEPHAANALPVGGRVIFPSFFPRTAERLARRGLELLPVDLSELAKAEGAVTCCSLIFAA